MTTVHDVIVHCQKQIKKEPAPDKILHYLRRLNRLRITIDDLRETGVGKTVNQLSRLEGEVGQYAGKIVEEWKAMVETHNGSASEEEKDKSDEDDSSVSEESEPDLEIDMSHADTHEPSPPHVVEETGEVEAYHDHDHSDDDEEEHESNEIVNTESSKFNNHTNVKEPSRDQVKSHDSSSSSDDDDEDDDDDDGSDSELEDVPDNKIRNRVDRENSNDSRNQSQSHIIERKEKEDDRGRKYDSSNLNTNLNASVNTTVIKQEYLEKDRSRDRHHSSNRGEEKANYHHHDRLSAHKDDKQDREKYKEKEKEKERSKDREKERHHQKDDRKHDRDRVKEKIADEDSRHKKHSKDRDRREDRDDDRKHRSSTSSSKHSSDKYNSEKHGEKHSEKHNNDKHNSEKHGSEKYGSEKHGGEKHSSEKHNPKREREREKSRYEEKEKTKEYTTSTHQDTSSSLKNKEIKEEPGKKKSGESSKESSSSSSAHKRKKLDTSYSSGDDKDKNIKKQKIVNIKIESEEIDSTSGLNFADVLGCLDVAKSTSKSKKSNTASTSSSSGGGSKSMKKNSIIEPPIKPSKIKTEHFNGHSAYKGNESKSKYKSSNSVPVAYESYAPPVLTFQPPKPVAPFLLPSDILAEERAGRTQYENGLMSATENTNEYDTLSSMMSSRKDRTKVYSGNKTGYVGEIPSLFNMCIRIIQDNLDSLGYTGGVPYDILKPALSRASVRQLANIEFYNPYLLENTNELWKFHCHRECRGQKPEELETWRDLYYRCQDERQERLKLLSSKVKKSVELSLPVRKAKLAYVEPSIRGPRFNKSKAATIKNGMKTLKHREEKGVKIGGPSYSASAGGKNSGTQNTTYEEAAIVIPSDSRAGSAPAPSVSRDYSSSSSALKKPRKAPLMQKTLKLIKSVYRR